MFEIPTGNYDKGLGVGKGWYKVPLWLQKNIGNWLLDGAGETIVHQTQYRSYPYGAFLLKYNSVSGWSWEPRSLPMRARAMRPAILGLSSSGRGWGRPCGTAGWRRPLKAAWL